MEIKMMKVKDLKPAPYNPRVEIQKGDAIYQKIKNNLEEFGLVEPIIWNKKTGYIVGGHQRLKVLTDMGIKEVEVSVVNLSEEKEKVLNIALNKISNDWDNTKLAELLSDMELDSQMLSGFETFEISALQTQFEENKEIKFEDFVQDEKYTETRDDDGQRFVAYLSFDDRLKLEKWMEDHELPGKLKKGSKTVIVDMTKVI